MALAGWADFATFAILVSLVGPEGESNIAASFIYEWGGLLSIFLVKVIAVMGAIWVDRKWLYWFGIILWTFGSAVNALSAALL